MSGLVSRMAGLLALDDVDGVGHSRLTVGFDTGEPTEGNEFIEIDDHALDGHPLRDELRRLALGDLDPFLKALGKVIVGVHHRSHSFVILLAPPRDSGSQLPGHGSSRLSFLDIAKKHFPAAAS